MKNQKETYGLKSSLKILLGKLADVKEYFGTLTDATPFKFNFDKGETDFYLNGPTVGESHLSLLRYAVKNGAFTGKVFAMPNGWQVVSFLIGLRARQQEARAADAERMDAKIVEVNAEVWLMLFNAHGGDFQAARVDFKARWGEIPVTDWMKNILNLSYKNAKQQYQAGNVEG